MIRIWIGNGPHHLFAECGGWEWLAKLAAYTEPGGLVLMEGMFNSKCVDLPSVVDESLFETYDTFDEEVSKYFFINKRIPSIEYTPGREFILMTRKGFC